MYMLNTGLLIFHSINKLSIFVADPAALEGSPKVDVSCESIYLRQKEALLVFDRIK